MAQNYIRQSTFSDGDKISASLFNNEYEQLVNAFSYSSTVEASTGHRHDGTLGQGGNIFKIGDLDFLNKIEVDSTNNRWGFYVEVSSAAVEQIRIQDGGIVPVTDSDIDIGTTSLRFKDAFIDTITTTSNVAIGGNLTVTGNATIAGNLTFGDAATDTVSFSADVASNLLPSTNNTFDLGASSSQWKDLYIDGTANIDNLVADTANINGGTITTLISSTGYIISVNATTVDTINLEATNLKAKDGTVAGSIADSTGVVTLASSVLTTTDINGGTIDSSVIGGSTPAAGTFTTLTANTSITGTLATAAQTNITSVGTLSSLTTSGNVTVGGNLTVNGTTTTLNTATLDVEDKNITLNKGSGDTSGSANGAGLTIQDAVDASTDATILWDTTNDEFDFSHPINVTGKITGTGTSVFANLDISGDVDVDGTLETDALTIGGVTSVPFEAADHSKLDGIEASATADQTASEIRTLVESASDSNVFTDADHTKLNAIEASADVTDATNVTAAGALMDSELTSIASVKALNQGVATTNSPTFAGITTSGTTNTANLTISGTQGSDGQVLTSTGSGVQWENAASGGVSGISSSSSSGTAIYINSSNKVGIGMSPSALFQVYSATAQEMMRVQNGNHNDAQIRFLNAGHSSTYFGIDSAESSNMVLDIRADKSFILSTNDTERFRVLNSGNMGIGTSSPSEKLHVNGTINATNFKINGSQGTDGQVLTSTGSGVAWESGGLPATPGTNNIHLGTGAGEDFDNGTARSTAIGVNALKEDSSLGFGGYDNTALGYNAAAAQTFAYKNTVIGSGAMATSTGKSESSDGLNVVIGFDAAPLNKKMQKSVVIGAESLKTQSSSTAYLHESVVIGYQALEDLTGSSQVMTIIGTDALRNATSATYTTAVGHLAGQHITTANSNTFFGEKAGSIITTGSQNTFIGIYTTGATSATQQAIVLGHTVVASGDNTFTFGHGSNDSAIANGATSITAPSDERYKEDITDSTAGLSFIKDLRPVTFRWKKEKDIPSTQKAYVEGSETRVMNDRTNHGFIAQEVKATIDAHPEIKDGFDMWKEDAADGRQRLGPAALIPILVKAIQELEARVNELESN